MKFALRRPSDAPEPATGTAPSTPVPRPRRGQPIVSYAAILDGHTLWLAVEACPGSLALRDQASTGGTGDTGDVIALRSDVTDDQPAYLSIRVDLADLPEPARPADRSTILDVVLVPPGGGSRKPVWTEPLPEQTTMTTPDAPDGRTRYRLLRGEDGDLQVRRTSVSPAAELVAMSKVGEAMVLELSGVAAGSTLLLVATKGGRTNGSVPLVAAGSRVTATITPADLTAEMKGLQRLMIDTDGARFPIRRPRNDLVRTDSAVLLPQLHDQSTGDLRARLRWRPRGLRLRMFEPGEAQQDDEQDDEQDDGADDGADDRDDQA